jgi:hypothetical protein
LVFGVDGDFGVEGVSRFNNARATIEGLSAVDLTVNIKITDGFDESLRAAGYIRQFYWKEEDAWELDLKSADIGGLDSLQSDNVDILFISTHGMNEDGISYLLYNSKDGELSPTSKDPKGWITSSKDWKLGDGDLEWLAIYSCHTIALEDFATKGFSRYQNIFNRLHLMLGSIDTMYMGDPYIDVGRNFADNLIDGDTIKSAWMSGVNELNDNHPAVLSAELESTWKDGSLDWPNTTMQRDMYWGRGKVTADVDPKSLYWIGIMWLE